METLHSGPVEQGAEANHSSTSLHVCCICNSTSEGGSPRASSLAGVEILGDLLVAERPFLPSSLELFGRSL
eukprot:13243341-Alexandrium_andersonii.AAC.1